MKKINFPRVLSLFLLSGFLFTGCSGNFQRALSEPDPVLITQIKQSEEAVPPQIKPENISAPDSRISPVPQPERRKVYLDAETFTSTVNLETQKVSLFLTGSLPTPCHRFDYEIAVVNQTYEISVFSYLPEEYRTALCPQSLEPFEVEIPLTESIYPIKVNS